MSHGIRFCLVRVPISYSDLMLNLSSTFRSVRRAADLVSEELPPARDRLLDALHSVRTTLIVLVAVFIGAALLMLGKR